MAGQVFLGDVRKAGGNAFAVQVGWRLYVAIFGNTDGQAAVSYAKAKAGF